MVIILSLLLPLTVCAKTYRGTVERVTDGDTVVIDGIKVRLIGIDAPELQHKNTPLECYAMKATEYARTRLLGRKVKYVTGGTRDVQDRYGRLLVYLYDDQGFFNEDMITQGYAFAFRKYAHTYKKKFVKDEDAAKTARRGLWGTCPIECTGRVCETGKTER